MPPAETVKTMTLPDPATERQIAPLPTDSAEIVPLVCADVRTLSKGGVLADLVCADLRARAAFGVRKYGQPLRVRNGRSGLIDAYQEALDLCDYLRQAQEQGEGDPLVYRQALRMALRLRATLLRRRQAPAQLEVAGDVLGFTAAERGAVGMLLIYVAGPLRPKYGRTQEEHCAVAFAVAARLWEAGHVPFCPHTTTLIEAQCHADFDTYIKGDLLIVSRCDGVVLLPHWRESEGTLMEEAHARRLGLPVWEYPDLPPSDGATTS